MDRILIPIIIFVVIWLITLLGVMTRYRKCPSDKIMVIYGRVGKDKDGNERSAICLHGGAAFVWPIIQDYEFLDLNPFTIDLKFKEFLINATVAISTELGVIQNAAERLLGLPQSDISDLVKDITHGQLLLASQEEDITNKENFLNYVSKHLQHELRKIGIKIIDLNMINQKN